MMNAILKALSEKIGPQRKGAMLEFVLVDVLNDLGFLGVKKQLSGSQYGFDVIAYKLSPIDGRREVWKFECKNLSKSVTINDIAPKLIWHYGTITIDQFVIVTPSSISNDLIYLLEQQEFPIPISLWAGETLAGIIEQSPKAMERLGLEYIKDTEPAQLLAHIPIYPPRFFTLDVVHQLDPPYSFDYIKVDEDVVKAYSEYEFRLLIYMSNLTKAPITVQSLDVVTLHYQKITSRILRLRKAKGLYEPIEIQFSPSTVEGGESEILGKKVWQIEGGQGEIIALSLHLNARPGLYRLIFRASVLMNGKLTTQYSPQFMLFIQDKNNDLLNLQVFNRHYDSPTSLVLNLNEDEWSRLKQYTKKDDCMIFLGPTFREAMYGYTDKNWTIRSCKIEKIDDREVRIDPQVPSELVLDLEGVIDEELVCGFVEFTEHMLEKQQWSDIILAQINRRVKETY
jgi:Holliday junction resolvase